MIASGSANRGGRQETMAERTLKHVERVVSDHLDTSASGSKFRVRLRLYAGWYSGRTHTPYRQGIIKVMNAYGSRTRLYLDGRVAFPGGHDGIQLGDRLACVPGRLARRHEVHLLDTLRQRDGTKDEKMVDTALTVDLLGLASRKEADRYIVVPDYAQSSAPPRTLWPIGVGGSLESAKRRSIQPERSSRRRLNPCQRGPAAGS